MQLSSFATAQAVDGSKFESCSGGTAPAEEKDKQAGLGGMTFVELLVS